MGSPRVMMLFKVITVREVFVQKRYTHKSIMNKRYLIHQIQTEQSVRGTKR